MPSCENSITSLFAALCIHTIDIRTAEGVAKRLAESRAQMCLLGLKEIQKYWSINNLVLDLFFQYLDDSTAQRLNGDQSENEGPRSNTTVQESRNESHAGHVDDTQRIHSSLQPLPEILESELYLSLFGSNLESGDTSTLDLGRFFDPQQPSTSPVQMGGMQYLERCL